ncbi:DNA-binding transcriptional regulator YhcF (GntR family) [Anseongella ginsenosidimutans]|uniref:DNA-binding transcriptional regulator YhcF (GntR family) n=1 Tax=Anseongella ginsenosidimutans TaxID=496056 RepID=A0A4V2UU80_9SPHI|nr:GntR family transcriptional regulator [Anseongella ginsenosidimutans]QEC51740.1 GntR family transcriptional regulator [Anseongella ginsenosidimutans]TCS89103.1 DNA-binding transcriptional regulator YhcF (GntR family) [Anseongella ginsenosidimutans]
MQFYDNGQAIYLQIAGYMCEKVLLKTFQAGAKIPSVRELAVQLAVNPNTVMRTYDFLKQLGIIYDKRGIGYFVAEDAVTKARSYMKEDFTSRELPSLLRGMYLLGLEPEDLKPNFDAFKKQYNEDK